MGISDEDFTIGIEEEYLLVDRESRDLAEAPPGLMEECAAELADQVSLEFLQCQIEVGTKVCQGVTDARDDMKRLRACIHKVAASYGLAPIAASCHPFAEWNKQHHTDKDRYHGLRRELGGVARRMLICGQHVHVGIKAEATRIDLMNQVSYFLPHLLALSGSSPFWKGEDTGLASYRLTVFDNLPRTGLPPRFSSWSEYQRSIGVIINTGVIEDSSKIWWDLRPSARFPTLESRICDVSPVLEDTITIAAVTQCLMRMLWRLRRANQRWRIYDSFLVGENRWRAQRYGMSEGLIDFGAGEVVPFATLMDELIEMTAEDAAALGCSDEVARVAGMARRGSSADRQRRLFQDGLTAGKTSHEALVPVVDMLIEEFTQGL